MSFLRQKFLWVGTAVVIVVLLVFGLAMMGSVTGAKPIDIPVALVMLDQELELPDGSKLAVGQMVQEKLLGNKQLPLKWELVTSHEAAEQGLREQHYYGALIFPSDLSSGVMSLQSPNPNPAAVTLLINEGMNPQAVAAVKQILGKAMNSLGPELSKQILSMMGQQTEQLSINTAEALLMPIKVNEISMHSPGKNHANGSAPNILTQIIWVSSMVTSIFMFIAGQKTLAQGISRWKMLLYMTSSGILIGFAASGLLVWMASSWYGMDITGMMNVWLFLWLAASTFFLLQSSLLHWLGFPAMAIIVLLLFFSMPVINMAPEFLPQAAQVWLYSWTPLRFVSEGLRSIMYFGASASVGSAMLWWFAGASLTVLASSGFKPVAQADHAQRSI